MTKDEAIELLDCLLGMVDDNQGNDYDEAFHMAIDALKEQPEPHGVCMDCLMKNVCRFKTGLGDCGYCSQWRGEDQ